MKKLKLSQEEQNKFLSEVATRLSQSFRTKGIDKLSIEDLKKDLKAVPKDVKQPKIYITASAYVKMMEYVRQSPIEISWHGLVHRDLENNTYLVYDALIFPQINSATTTTADEEGFAKWQMDLISDMNFPIEDLRMHGHSHVNMNVFSSGVDDQYQEDLLHKVEDGDYYLFMIFNKKQEICVLLYDYAQNVLFETADVFLDIITEDGTEIATTVAYEIQENCKKAPDLIKFKKSAEIKKSTEFYPVHDYFEDDDWDMPLFNSNKKNIKGGKRKHGSK